MQENQTVPPLEATLDSVMTQTERSYIREVLERTDGNITAAATTLGVSRQGLYKKMKRLGIDSER